MSADLICAASKLVTRLSSCSVGRRTLELFMSLVGFFDVRHGLTELPFWRTCPSRSMVLRK